MMRNLQLRLSQLQALGGAAFLMTVGGAFLQLGCGQSSGDVNAPSGGRAPTIQPGDEDDVTNWAGEDERPELAGSPTLGIEVNLSDSEAIAPAGIFFGHTGPMNDYYYWTVRRVGTTEPEFRVTGSQAAYVFEQPGEYTIELERVDPATGEWGVDTADLVVGDFIGTTHYFDAEDGSDAADGISPQTAWQSASKVHELLETGADDNQRFLFKRGQVFPLPSGQLINSLTAQRLRFGAYASDNGEDDTTLERPEIRAEGADAQGDVITLVGEVSDIVFQDLKFVGGYRYALPPNAEAAYGVRGVWAVDIHDVTFLRAELTGLGTGLYIQGMSEDVFIHQTSIHHIQSHGILGAVHRYSLQDSEVEYTSQAHNHYLGADEGVIRKTLFRRSGQSSEGWHQCGLRIDSGERRARRLYIARNHLLKTTGSPLCIGQNSSDVDSSTDIVLEANIFDGQPPEEGEFWDSQPIISLKSTQNMMFRNNVLLNLRGAVSLERNGAVFSNVRMLNNTFRVSEQPRQEPYTEPLVHLSGSASDFADIQFKNNIVDGVTRIFDFPSEDAVSSTQIANNVLWNNGDDIVNFIGGNPESMTEWGARGQGEGNVLAAPLLVQDSSKVYPGNEHSLTPDEGSPALGAGQDVPVLLDYYGKLRGARNAGALYE
jgi:hypothetical protein